MNEDFYEGIIFYDCYVQDFTSYEDAYSDFGMFVNRTYIAYREAMSIYFK